MNETCSGAEMATRNIPNYTGILPGDAHLFWTITGSVANRQMATVTAIRSLPTPGEAADSASVHR